MYIWRKFLKRNIYQIHSYTANKENEIVFLIMKVNFKEKLAAFYQVTISILDFTYSGNRFIGETCIKNLNILYKEKNMPVYVYKAVTDKGLIVKNKVEEVSKQTLIKRLKSNGVTPIEIIQVA